MDVGLGEAGGLSELNLQLQSRLVARKMTAHATASKRRGLHTSMVVSLTFPDFGGI